MKDREAIAWLIIGIGCVWIYTHWTLVKTAWKYRDQLEQAGVVLDDLQSTGVIKL